MQETLSKPRTFSFLEGEGEMRELTRNFDWSKTSLGPIEQWPQSLCTTLGILLHSSLPMFLFWGDDLTCFYNDAYRPSLGDNGKHPALGKNGKEVWPEIWDFIGPLIDKVLANGGSVWFEDQLVPIYRNGSIEEVYWTFSYSPVYNDDGKIEGVFVACTETTQKVLNLKRIEENESKYRSLFETMDQGFCVAEMIFDENNTAIDYRFIDVNPVFESLTGIKNAPGKTARELLPALEEKWLQIYSKVALTGEPIRFTEGSNIMNRWFEVYAFRLGDTGSNRIAILFTNITQKRKAELELKESKDLLQGVFDASPNSISVYEPVFNDQGNIEDLKILMFNAFTESTIGRSDIVGKLYSEEFPHTKTTGKIEEFKKVINTGEAIEFEKHYEGEGMNHWFRFFANKVGDLLMVTTEDITQRKISEQAIRDSESRFQNLVRDSTAAIVVLVGNDMKVEIVNEAYGRLINHRPEELLHKPLFSVVPEAKDYYLPLLEKVLTTGEPVHLYDSPFSIFNNGVKIEGYLHIVYQPYRDVEGNIIGVMAIIQDVTEQILARKKLEESEAHFELLSNTVPAMIFYLDKEERYQSYNETFMQWFNVDANEAIGKTVKEFIGEQAYQNVLPHLTIAYAGQQEKFEMQSPSKISGTKWLSIVYTPHKIEDGKVLGVIVHATDITNSKLTEMALRESENRFRSLIKEAPVATCLFVGREMKIALANEKMINYWGKDENVIGMPLEIAVPELKGQPYLDILDNVFVTGKTHEAKGSLALLKKDGELRNFYFDYTYKPIFNPDGTVYGIMDMAIDVTAQVLSHQQIEQEVALRTKELAIANEALQTINQELQRSNHHLEEFAHAASHDLKEPIRKIHFFTTRLKEQLKEQTDKEQGQTFTRIESATERMGTLIDDLLLYSHISQRPQEKDPVDLNDKLKRVLEDLELDIQEKQAKIHVKELPVVQGYPRQLQQLLQNLISNAVKYSKADIAPEIEISSKQVTENGRNYFAVEVSDNGIGFEEEYYDKIFQMFTRLHGKHEYSGTGVGLSIVKKVVENHNGFIKVKSQKGIGSSFTVYLPVI